jgi:hypothetical protein
VGLRHDIGLLKRARPKKVIRASSFALTFDEKIWKFGPMSATRMNGSIPILRGSWKSSLREQTVRTTPIFSFGLHPRSSCAGRVCVKD